MECYCDEGAYTQLDGPFFCTSKKTALYAVQPLFGTPLLLLLLLLSVSSRPYPVCLPFSSETRSPAPQICLHSDGSSQLECVSFFLLTCLLRVQSPLLSASLILSLSLSSLLLLCSGKIAFPPLNQPLPWLLWWLLKECEGRPSGSRLSFEMSYSLETTWEHWSEPYSLRWGAGLEPLLIYWSCRRLTRLWRSLSSLRFGEIGLGI